MINKQRLRFPLVVLSYAGDDKGVSLSINYVGGLLKQVIPRRMVFLDTHNN